jgi:hypothetical protein
LLWEATVLRRDEGGASLVEFALVLPIFLMLVFGLVSAGIAYNHDISLTHAAREAGRYAATLPVSGNFASLDLWLDDVAARVVADATGSLDPGAPGLLICVAYVYKPTPPGSSAPLDQTMSRTVIDSGPPAYTDQPCLTGAEADNRPELERRVQVRVERQADFSVIFWSTDVTLRSSGVSRYEAFLDV